LRSVEREQSSTSALKDVGGIEDQFFRWVGVCLLHSSEYNSINKLETGISNVREGESLPRGSPRDMRQVYMPLSHFRGSFPLIE